MRKERKDLDEDFGNLEKPRMKKSSGGGSLRTAPNTADSPPEMNG
jgi:hypothetical protein